MSFPLKSLAEQIALAEKLASYNHCMIEITEMGFGGKVYAWILFF